MTFVTKTFAAVMVASLVVACSVEAETPEDEAVESTEQALKNNGTSQIKTKKSLEADGYTCSSLEGTTVTLCWKNGSPTYSCDESGRCIQHMTQPPPPRPIPWPVPTVVAPISG